MAQEREAAEAIIQGRLLKCIQAEKRLDKKGAQWCVDHAIPVDLRKLADGIEAVAKRAD